MYKSHKKDNNLEGEESLPALNGGYIKLIKNEKVIFLAKVPSPNMFVDRYSDSLVENKEYFEDEDGEYEFFIFSSSNGVKWEVKINSKDNKDLSKLKNEIKIEYEEAL